MIDAEELRSVAENFVIDNLSRDAWEGVESSSDQVERSNADCPNVNFLIILLTSNQLRSHEHGSAEFNLLRTWIGLLNLGSELKIGQEGADLIRRVSILIDHDVVGLDVSVVDALTVERFDDLEQLLDHLPHLRLSEALLHLHGLNQVATRHMFSDHVHVACVLDDLEHSHGSRVIEEGESGQLASMESLLGLTFPFEASFANPLDTGQNPRLPVPGGKYLLDGHILLRLAH